MAPDVLVIGGGNAALCAAITAAEEGASVIIVEAAPKQYRGGNSRHTRNFRCMHQKPLDHLIESYTQEEYYADLLKVTKGKTDERLAKLTISQSEECLSWMKTHGVKFQPSLSGTLSLARTNAFFMGGGKGLVNAYYRRAQNLGVKVLYDAEVRHIEIQGQKADFVEYRYQDAIHKIKPKAIIVASGGFQADIDWLAEAWGEAARNFLIRGTPYNRGVVLKDLLKQGVKTIGDAEQCHAVAIDGRSPKYDGGIVTRLDCVPFSIVVNENAERFYDEGEDIWPKRYAIWGRLIAAQPNQLGYVIIDSKSIDLFMPSVFPPVQAESLEELAQKMALPADKLRKTIEAFNQSCGNDARFHPTEPDGVCTQGITPPKSNWARPINTPPYYGYSLRTGVTFTYLGLHVDENSQCSNEKGKIDNLFAAGESMAGSILGEGYLAGFGMTIGTVFGRIAGREAALHAK